MADKNKGQAKKPQAPAKMGKQVKTEQVSTKVSTGVITKASVSDTPNRVQQAYVNEVVPALIKKFGYTNKMQVPKLEKIIISSGLGDIKDNAKSIQMALNEIKIIAGQQPILTKARKSVANFKLRAGMTVGIKVTLRGKRMYEFYDKLVSIALPRVRDFRGLSPDSFDGKGNFCIGLKEQLMFPEIQYDQVEKIRGMDVCFVTTANTDEEGRELLRALGMPFKK